MSVSSSRGKCTRAGWLAFLGALTHQAKADIPHLATAYFIAHVWSCESDLVPYTAYFTHCLDAIIEHFSNTGRLPFFSFFFFFHFSVVYSGSSFQSLIDLFHGLEVGIISASYISEDSLGRV